MAHSVITITITHSKEWGDYRVPGFKGEWDAYYTDDKQDALDSAKDIYRRCGKPNIIYEFKVKEVENHPSN